MIWTKAHWAIYLAHVSFLRFQKYKPRPNGVPPGHWMQPYPMFNKAVRFGADPSVLNNFKRIKNPQHKDFLEYTKTLRKQVMQNVGY
jgi:hypothetical protein